MKKIIAICLFLVIAVVVSTLFIKSNNDHKECDTSFEYSKDTNGNQVVTEIHNCKEKYNF